ncbi:MAG: response regulator [Eubacterium sp.]|nr:response regulator [Eubacterium sp.]
MITISVDDELNVAEEISKMMGQIDPSGTHKPFSNVEDALDFVDENKPDVAWLDIEMPVMSGLEMAMKVKTLSPKTNIVFVTGHDKFLYQAFQLHASGFILKPATKEALERELENLRMPVEPKSEGLVRVQCFGNFEVFDQDGSPIKFKRSKSKELLAYMIDRRGALCSIGELCGVLFEDREEDRALKKQLRVFLSSLKDDLEKAGAGKIFVKGWNAYGVDCSRIDCDYLNYLKGDSYAVNSFLGEYMLQYSWAEMTLGEIIMKSESFDD